MGGEQVCYCVLSQRRPPPTKNLPSTKKVCKNNSEEAMFTLSANLPLAGTIIHLYQKTML